MMAEETRSALAQAEAAAFAREPNQPVAAADQIPQEGQPSVDPPVEVGVVQSTSLNEPAQPAADGVHNPRGTPTTPTTRIIPQAETTVVPPSSSSEKATITFDDIDGSDGTVRDALQLWNARKGPVIYNVFQSAFYALQRDLGAVDAEAYLGESLTLKQQRILSMFNEIQTANHGPDHKAQALLKLKAQKAKTARLPSRGDAAGAQPGGIKTDVPLDLALVPL